MGDRLLEQAQPGQRSRGIAGEVQPHPQVVRRGPPLDDGAINTLQRECAAQRETGDPGAYDEYRCAHGDPFDGALPAVASARCTGTLMVRPAGLLTVSNPTRSSMER